MGTLVAVLGTAIVSAMIGHFVGRTKSLSETELDELRTGLAHQEMLMGIFQEAREFYELRMAIAEDDLRRMAERIKVLEEKVADFQRRKENDNE